MERMDVYPTYKYFNYELRAGRPFPFGVSYVPNGINFSIYSRHAEYCTLVLYKKNEKEPVIEIPFRGIFNKIETDEEVWASFRIGHVFCMIVFNVDYEDLEYGYRFGGPYAKVKRGEPALHRFDYKKVLLDPYAMGVIGRKIWREKKEKVYSPKGCFVFNDFDWEADSPLEIPIEDLIIYEMHVRGFTMHPSANIKYPGTFSGISEKVPYLKELGINCIELLPIFEFDEFDNPFSNPETGQPLVNYWGYNPTCFFAPKAGYTVSKYADDATLVSDQFKKFVKDLHSNGIEIILDVVFNHTNEGNENGPVLSLKGIDNATYYMLTPEGFYYNFTGTGNTLNCNNPIVRNLILDCLRFWVSEYHIDGFRFDLAAVLGRDPKGNPLQNPPLLETLAYDPVLGKCKLIAEAWDCTSGYQAGSFPRYEHWVEWNGHYRDVLRQFLRGDEGQLPKVSQIIQGCPQLYSQQSLNASVNFITCHDGFTLLDLFSYNQKHNWANGENNRDGNNENFSFNYGCEGETNNNEIIKLRIRQIKNAVAILMISKGIPMILMGDEMGRTQWGNNNTYAQDNEMNWLNWSLLEKNKEIYHFFKGCIQLRKTYPILRLGPTKNKHEEEMIIWHGTIPWNVDWSDSNKGLALMFIGFLKSIDHRRNKKYHIYMAMNMSNEELLFNLPSLPNRLQWHIYANTYEKPPNDIYPLNSTKVVNNNTFIVKNKSVIILIAKKRIDHAKKN